MSTCHVREGTREGEPRMWKRECRCTKDRKSKWCHTFMLSPQWTGQGTCRRDRECCVRNGGLGVEGGSEMLSLLLCENLR